jgi:hypothetical protein
MTHEETRKTLESLLEGSPCCIVNMEFGDELGNDVGPEPMHFRVLIGVSDEFARRVVQEDVRRASCRLADDWRGYVTAYIHFEWDADPEFDCLCADFVEVLSTTPRRDGTADDDTPIEF